MNIILTDIANLSVFIVPIVPTNVKIQSNGSITEVNSLERRISIIDNEELKTIEWSSFFPVNKNYPFTSKGALSNGWAYVAFLELMKKYHLPIRVICTTKSKIPILNSLMTISSFDYSLDNSGDINYSITFKEFYEKFYKFLERDKEVLKYIKNINWQSEAQSALKKFGLMR